MSNEDFEADRLASALDGALAPNRETQALLALANDIAGALGIPSLDAGTRARIWEHSQRLLDGAGLSSQPRQLWRRVPVSRRGGAVIGGVAAASLAAAIGYAVIHERRVRAGSSRVAA